MMNLSKDINEIFLQSYNKIEMNDVMMEIPLTHFLFQDMYSIKKQIQENQKSPIIHTPVFIQKKVISQTPLFSPQNRNNPPLLYYQNRYRNKLEKINKNLRLKNKNSPTKINVNKTQQICCIQDCNNPVFNRIKDSLKLKNYYKFKRGFIENRKIRICNPCYFSDLYRFKNSKK